MNMKNLFLLIVFVFEFVYSFKVSNNDDDKPFLDILSNINTIPLNRYCVIDRCLRNTHTMCIYNQTFPARECGRVYRSGLTQAEKNKILNVHNELRTFVYGGYEERGRPGPQPAAIRNVSLQWDTELETIAQRWADQCKLHQDICRNVDRFCVGQSVIHRDYDEQETDEQVQLHQFEQLIKCWYDEVEGYNCNHVQNYSFEGDALSNPITMHYTQIVWENTVKLGCGAIRFYRVPFLNPQIFLVCNYGPAGNDLDRAVYQIRYRGK